MFYLFNTFIKFILISKLLIFNLFELPGVALEQKADLQFTGAEVALAIRLDGRLAGRNGNDVALAEDLDLIAVGNHDGRGLVKAETGVGRVLEGDGEKPVLASALDEMLVDDGILDDNPLRSDLEIVDEISLDVVDTCGADTTVDSLCTSALVS